MDYCLMFILGVLVATIISYIINRTKRLTGTIYINSTNPEKDIFGMELNDVNDLYTYDTVLFKIVRDDKNASK